MDQTDYLSWAINNTPTTWWNDSIETSSLALGIQRGAIGATSNPYLAHVALLSNRQAWSNQIQTVLTKKLTPEEKAEELMRIAIVHAAEQLYPEYERSAKRMGYVCAQVNPGRAGDRDIMGPMARRFSRWAPNIAVKLPVTAAGLDVLEDCVAEGITCTLTISYTVPQVIAVAERYRKGIQRARDMGVEPGRCFAVIMIGRLDDYLRDIAHDMCANVSESDIRQAGIAVTKRAYAIFQQRRYEADLIVAALRGTYHMTELAGARVIMSIAPAYQKMLVVPDLPKEERIDAEVPNDVIERLSQLPEFTRAFDPEGMDPGEFITYGVTQKTLAQFYESGWKPLGNFSS
jgi:transaldolase